MAYAYRDRQGRLRLTNGYPGVPAAEVRFAHKQGWPVLVIDGAPFLVMDEGNKQIYLEGPAGRLLASAEERRRLAPIYKALGEACPT
ncbi:hypothetical protein [Heliophilum fasciatum]|uniref:Uncharacterized protein n=1 Tax=Heliophilum fasciatum TaxID=35700 RepID=A0A4R2RKI6_9FIRM|nr:hypothetical protein [Heliophilum fasciatum]MCW2278591.1 hypothetical protein [Heliophilum fasciatum]TCP62707.1 hypothetical protein EDD73_11955 [Heliophilum fasciatum]